MGHTSSRHSSLSSIAQDSETSEQEDSNWGLEFSDSWSNWNFSSVLLGFSPRIDYSNNVKVRLQPWCTGGRHFTVIYVADKPPEKSLFPVTIVEECIRQETRIRLPASVFGRLQSCNEPTKHYLKAIQVVGYRDGLAVLQVNCIDKKVEFHVLHMKNRAVTGVYKTEVPAADRHYLHDVIISPDLSCFLLKPNAIYALNFCRGDYRNETAVISCKGHKCPLIKTLFKDASLRLLFSFDPRFRFSRVAVGNVQRQGKECIAIYDLTDEKILLQNEAEMYQRTQNLVHSPDGALLASLVLERSVKDGLFNFPRVFLYSTTDMSCVSSFRIAKLSETPTLSPAAIFPLFNDTGNKIAIPFGEQGSFYQQAAGVNVFRTFVSQSLKSACRLVIRKHHDFYDVSNLPLPTSLKKYLRFQPIYD